MVFRKYIAEKLVQAVGDEEGAEGVRIKLENILEHVQKGEKIELTETQLHRLLWLINRCKEVNIVPEIARLISLILEPNYTGNQGEAVMAVEKIILEWIVEKKDIEKSRRLLDEKTAQEKERILTVRRTVRGDLRFEGPGVPDNIKMAVKYVDRFKAPEPAEIEEVHYVLIDKYRVERFKETIDQISSKWNVRFVTDIPDGVRPEEIVVMIDPEDADKGKWANSGFIWYLPLMYSRKSFILAAWLSINKDKDIKDTPVYKFVKEFYEELLGEKLEESEVISWFKEPWGLKDRIIKISENLKLLRIALEQIDSSA